MRLWVGPTYEVVGGGYIRGCGWGLHMRLWVGLHKRLWVGPTYEVVGGGLH